MSTTSPRPGGVTGPTRTPGAGPTRIEERTILLHGQRVTYLESGADSGGPVIVLLHGLAGSSSTWLPVMPRLGAHAHAIAPDLLGHGQSAKPGDGDYSLGAHAASLRDLLVALGFDRATVVGHSFGGGVAMQFAYQFPSSSSGSSWSPAAASAAKSPPRCAQPPCREPRSPWERSPGSPPAGWAS